MAQSSRQSAIFGSNDWKSIYQTFNQADFRSYDYETLRKTFIDYLRNYYPETFNDYIESSEFIALLDIISFMGQSLAFRNDLNTRENFIDTAERRDSVIKLANLVSYNPKRNIAAQGYLKVISISTTENIVDLNGINLSNLTILWNDPANNYWLEQFNAIINASLVSSQRVGKPGNSNEILGIVTDEYGIRIPSGVLPIVPFTSNIDGTSVKFELVSASSVDTDYVYELPPATASKFNILYRNDKLGYGSPDTGYFFFFKQGSLLNFDFSLNQKLDNRVVDIGTIQGVNNDDTWLYDITNGTPDEWQHVESLYDNSAAQDEGNLRKVFSTISRTNDQVSYSFGDGVFSKIPIGSFRAYVRTSNGLTYIIDPSDLRNIAVTLNYTNKVGRTETLTFTMSLQTTVTNALARESLGSIKLRAPRKYYTQNRMVNGEDCNNFPYTLYGSILKSKAINKSSVGISKNLDLLDPTGKYSSINSFASDGALWQDSTVKEHILTIISIGSITSFLSTTLVNTLASKNVIQYYIDNYPRYTIDSTTVDYAPVYWKESSVNANSLTGYFYVYINNKLTPVALGTYSSNNLLYVTTGALLKLKAPIGYYFNSSNRLVSGLTANQKTEIWTTVLNVVGDGYNNGRGVFTNGTGPVTLNGYIPEGAILTEVIPVFQTTLPASVVQECITRIELQQDFSLVFDNSLSTATDRWSVELVDDPNALVTFISQTNSRYSVQYKSLQYYFGSVAETRFVYDKFKLVYDPKSGSILQDSIDILGINANPNSSYPLNENTHLNIIGQTVEKDGYINDFNIEIASCEDNNNLIIKNPEFFEQVTGYTGNNNTSSFVFFRLVQDAINLTTTIIVPTSDVIYTYPNKTAIEVVKYEYPEGQLFYAYAQDKFYTSVRDTSVTTIYYSLSELTDMYMRPGRQGLKFQYRHNSNNTTRIDPATTNIIDLYVVTQSYYIDYYNWLNDTTGTVNEPLIPTINELMTNYSDLNQYKMMSDNLVLNSVVFKPLFGVKADPLLRATIKIIKSSDTKASNSEIKTAVLAVINTYFDLANWNFGDTFYFSELSAYVHSELGDMVSSIVLVPNDSSLTFGDLYEIRCLPYEIFVNAATADDIVVITALTPYELQTN